MGQCKYSYRLINDPCYDRVGGMKKRILLIVLVVLAIAGGGYGAWAKWGVKAEAPVAQSSGKPLAIEDTSPKPKEIPKVADIIKATNDYRATKGLAPLTESPLLDKSACLKADDMVAKNYWAHVSPDGTQPWYWIQQVNYAYKKAGENLAYGFRTGYEVIAAWKNSPTHEVNLSGSYMESGACVVSSKSYQGGENTVIVAHYATPQ